jgi:hypothetical protein
VPEFENEYDEPGIIDLSSASGRARSTQPLHDPAVARQVPVVIDGAGPVPVSRALVPDPTVCRCRQPYCRYCGQCHNGNCDLVSVICASAQADVMRRKHVPADEPLAPPVRRKRWLW